MLFDEPEDCYIYDDSLNELYCIKASADAFSQRVDEYPSYVTSIVSCQAEMFKGRVVRGLETTHVYCSVQADPISQACHKDKNDAAAYVVQVSILSIAFYIIGIE